MAPNGSVGLWLRLGALSAVLVAAGGPAVIAASGWLFRAALIWTVFFRIVAVAFGYLAFAAHLRRRPFKAPDARAINFNDV